ncbi:triose-phosphate isomerase [Jannaschia seohaensis]|uniref:Triosephosphate isomerase n=1 Tax=Jannaschia seohaensis TaxID=475081 RepID=A0A2Y9C3C7_9RHOB|nr:triose-phosphate isomerase [Jannaschia seohaensis]PWJ12129.1 triosephosphate isomerase [Jannaschia seohaensis]SSA51232.1 triosephosphate isomerase (TIM) [Jannaschia seohaensis]
MPQKYAAGNWKMNGLVTDLTEVLEIDKGVADLACQTVICLPATLIYAADGDPRQTVEIGGQYCHPAASGAHTGDISAEMLAEAGASYVITGHSERRTDHGETDADVRAQTEAAWRAGLVAILCIGETLDQREAGETLSVLMSQIDGSLPEGATAENTILAYEPVWAIGTGKVATPDQVAEVHDALREKLGPEMSLLYGGSVKAANAAELFALTNVDGALVGGASLKAADFVPIAKALSES